MKEENVIYEESYNTELCNGCKEYVKLQEENEKLQKENGTLKFENHDLSEYIKVLKEDNEKLKAQNEKMKCCGNCKHYKNNGTECCLKNEGAFFECNLSEEWELAE